LIKRIVFVALLLAYVLVVIPFSTFLKNRPVVVKLGYFPEAEILKTTSGEFRTIVAEYAVVKVLFYYGTVVEKFQEKIIIKPEFYNMFKTLESSVKLDPYNMDAYYFMQAAFTWELGRAKDVNAVLAYGMKYRTWDYQLPFFAGFNAAYFLKDYKAAAAYMQRAAELSGDPMYTTLAARYFYEANQTRFGIIFLENMVKQTKDRKLRKIYEMRRDALLAVKMISDAVEQYKLKNGRQPQDIDTLVSAGRLACIPADPYGGTFFLDNDGIVRTTSKFASKQQQ